MTEPNVLDATIPCPDCCGSGEVTYGLPGFSCDSDQATETGDCEACGGTGTCRLGDLEPPPIVVQPKAAFTPPRGPGVEAAIKAVRGEEEDGYPSFADGGMPLG